MASRPSRKEARIARDNEKALKNSSKSVRLLESVKVDQGPRLEHTIQDSNLPRTEEDPVSIMGLKMTFILHINADRSKAWSWGQDRNWCSKFLEQPGACTIKSTMSEMANLTWSEILDQRTGRERKRRKKHHSQVWDSICEEAQERWVQIDRAEEELFRFRVGSKARIWGFREGAVFHVVWWDPEHNIYPTEK